MPTRRFAPATARNREPILAVLARVLPRSGLVLEVAGGTGEHAAFFSSRLPHLVWQPSEVDEERLDSIAAWRAETGAENLRTPIVLDVTEEPWPVEKADAIVCINMVHITPWKTTLALLAGAARRLPHGGVLYLYGPFRAGGKHTAPSNAAFDRDLRERDPDWGVRDLEDVIAAAGDCGLVFGEKIEMPANNLSLVFRARTPSPASDRIAALHLPGCSERSKP